MYRTLLICFLISIFVICGLAQLSPSSKMLNASKLVNDLKVLSDDDMQGRAPETPGGKAAREYITKRFRESGLKSFGSTYEQPYDFEYPRQRGKIHKGVNVLGYLDGSSRSHRFTVVTAHYDHLGVVDGRIFNGADDNASGTAALFTIAKYFKDHQPKNPMIFVAFDTEEGSGAGAREFLAHPPVMRNQIIMNVNVDMIGRDADSILYAVGTYHFPYLKPYLEKVATAAPVKLLFGHDVPNLKDVEDWTRDSDHYAFHRVGIPWIYFGVEDNEQHHQATDDFDTMTLPFYVHAVETVISSVKQFDANLSAIEKQKKPE